MSGETFRAAILSLGLAVACRPASPHEPEQNADTTEDVISQGTHRLTINGAELVYHVVGSGPPVIVLSGGPGAGWEYLQLPSRLAEHATLIHLELLGTGESARLEDPTGYSRTRDVADVAGLRAHLGVEKVSVLGHSYGGFVALEFALEHPDVVDRLILYDTTPTTGEDMWTDVNANIEARADKPWHADATAAMQATNGAQSDDELTGLLVRMMPLYFHEWPRASEETEALTSRLEFFVDRANHGTSIPYDVRPRLAEIKRPTLIIVGASDFICSPRMAAMIHEGIAGSELLVLEKSGHFGHLEQPDEFSDAIVRFLE